MAEPSISPGVCEHGVNVFHVCSWCEYHKRLRKEEAERNREKIQNELSAYGVIVCAATAGAMMMFEDASGDIRAGALVFVCLAAMLAPFVFYRGNDPEN